MLRIPARKLVLALALLAVAGTAAPIAASAHAATAETVRIAASEDVRWSPPVQADLQVLPRGKRSEGGVTKYFFTIKNNGPSNASPITAYKEVHVKADVGSGFMLQDAGYFSVPSLASGATKTITVSCTPPAGYSCKQATTMTLNNSYDPNNGNNLATIN